MSKIQEMKKYNAKEVEQKWQIFWQDNDIYAFDIKDKNKKVFSIDTPPPTVSGKMHIGHASSYSQEDFIARFKRMSGFNVFYPFGTDDNGLPTKLLIEKTKKVRASTMERKDFVNLCLKTLKEELRPKYIQDWKKIGMSCDFKMSYTTIDEHSRKISQQSFIDLYKDGREYRSEAAAMYCPKCRTAISQVECEDVNQESYFNDIVFKVKDENGKDQDLIIATTRPELLPACVSIFYHPDDERYKHLKNKKAKVPLFDCQVPILEDERADPQKGTGIVMCCTFGDSTDVEWQKAHKLPIKEAISRQGRMTALAQKYEGLKIKEAREQIIQDLKNDNLLISQKKISHPVNVHERCGTAIEFIHSKQWFIKYLDQKENLLKWGNELNWYPEHMKNRYDNWVKGLQWDWCISRQLPYGVPFPVWYCQDCDEVILANEKDLPVDPTCDKPPVSQCPKCQSKNIIPETDIINTWATSSLSPQIAASLIPERYNDLYPMTLRPQAHDIISFWLFNTVVKSQFHNHVNPWRDCAISGWVLGPHGKKMSKSKGNFIEPQKMIEKYSADALRYWSSGAKLGEDISFQEKDLLTGTKTVNKLWNASKFALMHLEDYDHNFDESKLELMDKWLLSKLNQVIQRVTKYNENYDYSKARSEVDLFFKQTFCDNYLEIIKDRIYNPDVRGIDAKKSAQYTLYHALDSILKMFAPIMPFITEEIYSYYFADIQKTKSIHTSNWPVYQEHLVNKEIDYAGDYLVYIIGEVRKFKSENALSLKTEISKINIKIEKSIFELFKLAQKDLKVTTKTYEILYDEVDKIDLNDTNIIITK